MNTTACCFTGHRHLPQEQMPNILTRLHYTALALIEEGFTTFLCGGALGFDMWAAIYIMSQKKIADRDIRLVLALPYPGYNVQR